MSKRVFVFIGVVVRIQCSEKLTQRKDLFDLDQQFPLSSLHCGLTSYIDVFVHCCKASRSSVAMLCCQVPSLKRKLSHVVHRGHLTWRFFQVFSLNLPTFPSISQQIQQIKPILLLNVTFSNRIGLICWICWEIEKTFSNRIGLICWICWEIEGKVGRFREKKLGKPPCKVAPVRSVHKCERYTIDCCAMTIGNDKYRNSP